MKKKIHIKKKKSKKPKLKAISLFSGMGGDTLGMEQAGVNVVAFSEYIPIIQKTHLKNFNKSLLLGEDVKSNITKIKDEEFEKYKNKIDIIFAGFPCQGYSNAGKKKVDDPRNTLFREFVRATRIIKPKCIIGENVKGLLNRKTGKGEKYIDIIEEEFNKIGYNIKYKLCKCFKYGVPQKRERLIILGFHESLTHEITFPPESSIIHDLKDIVHFSMEGALQITKEDYDFSKIPNDCILTDMENDEEGIGKPHPYVTLKTKHRDNEYKGKHYTTLVSFEKRDSPIHSEIINIKKPAKTIICTYGHQPRLLVPLRNKKGNWLRTLLPDELKQIQGFPKDYEICGNKKDKITQIGNAVPPPLIKCIVKHIKSKLF